MSDVWGFAPVGYVDADGRAHLVPQDAGNREALLAHAQEYAKLARLPVLYVSRAPQGCTGREKNTHAGRQFECEKGCRNAFNCAARSQAPQPTLRQATATRVADPLRELVDHAWSDGVAGYDHPSAQTLQAEIPLRSLWDEYTAAVEQAQATAAAHIWNNVLTHNGDPTAGGAQ